MIYSKACQCFKNLKLSKYLGLKFFSFILCAAGFFVISWHLLKDFSQNKTVVSSSFLKYEDGSLRSPSILICNKTAFKTNRITGHLHEYLKNTVELTDVIFQSGFISSSRQQVIFNNNSIREIYTSLKGRCFVFEPVIKVSILLI